MSRADSVVLLTVDVGNSQMVIGVFEGEELVDHWRLSTDRNRTEDELALLLDGLLGHADTALDELAGIAVCSVVPRITEALSHMARKYARTSAVALAPGVRTGMPIQIDTPREVGADRLANAIAAEAVFGRPAIVVDFGTATNFDVVSDAGAYIGGAIAPGIQSSMEALSARGAQLPVVGLGAPRTPIGRSTVEAMQSGAVYGFAGQVDRIVEEIAGELQGRPTVLATGGLASVVLEQCRTIDRHEPWLTLIGLRLVWERNQG